MRSLAALLPALSFGAVEFNRDIRPILSDKCFACHGPDAESRKIRLRLDSEAASRADLGGKFAVVPGDSSKSELIRRVTAEKPALRMPPPHAPVKLTPDEIEKLRAWIDSGAKWQKHWAFLPPERPAAPAVRNLAWTRNPIDAFVLARLEKEGLQPSSEAPKEVLLRRVTLDLTGLPPTPAETEAFLADSSPHAYERVVDRLLASPRYGEKLAIRWIDAARYADTNGYQTDADRDMWRWRDWVIQSFNKNLSYDRFAVEQLAGDLLPKPTLDQIVATGFNRNHRGNSEGGIVPEEYLAEYAVDRVETFSTVFLGVTMGCARCHNHKYDPFTQREFYQVFAYFNNIPELGRYLKFGNTPPWVRAPQPEQAAKIAELESQAKRAQADFEASRARLASAKLAWKKTLASEFDSLPAKALDAQSPLAELDGSKFVDLGDKGKFGFQTRFTASAWIRTARENAAIVTRAQDDDDFEGWGLYLVGGKLQVNLVRRKLDDSIRVESKAKIDAREWRHVAMTYDGSRVAQGVAIYLDGRPLETEILVDAINQDFKENQPLRVGGGGGEAMRFRGSLRDARTYARALDREEIEILAARRTAGEIAKLAKPSPAEVRKLEAAFLDTGASAETRAAFAAWDRARDRLAAFLDQVPTVMVMREVEPPKDTFLLLRGAYDKPGEKVSRGVPESLADAAQALPDRLALARWVADRRNPLTARVAVNRFWQAIFGTGIVKTVEDFGAQGEWPSHPELLDWLAVEFMESGWDVKRLHRTIVTSAAYRQSSKVSPALAAKDPENRLLARGPRLRLPAETVRDAALFAAGLLVEKQGGPSVKPYQPAGLWSELGGADYKRDSGEGLYRRSLYTFWKRTAPPPFMANFDSALREACTVREGRTNTPLQALNLMNDVTFVEAARALAQRVWTEGPERRIPHAFRLVVSRDANGRELAKLSESLAYFRDYYSTRPDDAKKLLAQGDSPTDPRIPPAELAALTSVASLILNLDEALTKE